MQLLVTPFAFYHKFNLCHRDVEDSRAKRGIIVSNESIRNWCIKFGRRLERNHQRFGDTLFYSDANKDHARLDVELSVVMPKPLN